MDFQLSEFELLWHERILPIKKVKQRPLSIAVYVLYMFAHESPERVVEHPVPLSLVVLPVSHVQRLGFPILHPPMPMSDTVTPPAPVDTAVSIGHLPVAIYSAPPPAPSVASPALV